MAVAAVVLAAWLIVYPRAPDLAAQTYRTELFGREGFTLFDTRWYGGHELLGYSLLFPALASLLGLRLVACLSVLASVVLFGCIARRCFVPRAVVWGTACFALCAAGDVWSGRLTFALGVSFALGALLAHLSARTTLAVALGMLCAAASPVAGLLLALAGVSEALWRRRARALLVLSAPAGGVALVLALLFGDGGFEPYPTLSFLATAIVIAVFLLALPPGWALLRTGALVYAAACVLCLVLSSPMGANVERYAVLLAAPLLVCALISSREAAARSERPGGGERSRGGWVGTGAHGERAGAWAMPAAGAALAVLGAWVLWGPVRETLAVAGNDSTSAAYYAPLNGFLAEHARAPLRVEVPLTRSHWEAALLAGSVSLARGWEKQLDERYDGVLLSSGLTADAYERWLHEQAVDYVALADAPLDPSSAREGALVRRGLPFLSLVFASRHWHVYAVRSPVALASGPGRLVSLGHDSFALRASRAGRFVVRVHFTSYWSVSRGTACVTQARDGWTAVDARAAGLVGVKARFSLGGALGLAADCPPVAGATRRG